jgi:hypothetical protein
MRARTMPDQPQRQSTVTCILTDVHFWVPVAVLIAGLLLLRALS